MSPTDARAGDEQISVTYDGGGPWRRFLRWYPFATMAVLVGTAPVISILLPNQIQAIEFATHFVGADAGVDLASLSDLRSAVAGGAPASPEQLRLLDVFARFDAARAQALAWVTAIGTLGPMIVQPVVGVLSDRTRSRAGRRAPWMVAGALGAAVFLVALRYSPSVALVALCWTLALSLANTGSGPTLAMVADRVPPSRTGTASALGGLGNLAGGVFGVVVAGALFARIGLDAYFVVALVVVLCVVGFVLRNPDRSSTGLAVPPFSWATFLRGFLVPLRDRDFRLVFLSRVVIYFGQTSSSALSFYMLQSYVTPALSAAEATRIVPLLAVATLPTTLVGMSVSGWLSDRVGRRKPFVVAASLLMAAAMIVPLVSPTLPALFVQTALTGLAFGVYIPVDQALFIDVLPEKGAAGRDLGVANVATSLGQALGRAIAGQAVALAGGYGVVWPIAAVLCVASAVAILPVRRAR